MIRHYGPMGWRNVHATQATYLADLIDIDNVAEPGSPGAGNQRRGFDLLRHAAGDVDSLVREARERRQVVRGLGAAWAHTDIGITKGCLLNTKLLNACFDFGDRFFDPKYDSKKRPLLVLAQCGISMGELNRHLEVTAPNGVRRALKTAGIGAGQTVVGAVAGNTHGAALNFGSTPDFVVGLHLVTGVGKSWWIERASQPVLNASFAEELGAELLRDDEVFDAAVVSFGAFGMIAAVAIETDELYDLEFAEVEELPRRRLLERLEAPEWWNEKDLHHTEFVFDPNSSDTMLARAHRFPHEPAKHRLPAKPTWIVRDANGFAPADRLGGVPFTLPFPPHMTTELQFRAYREQGILDDVRGTPGQLFTATITYLEGYIESAFAVSINDARRTIEICSSVLRERGLASIGQVRIVHPSRALLAFTRFAPKTLVFEFAAANDASFPLLEQNLSHALDCSGIPHAYHWSKNSGLTPERLERSYGRATLDKWKRARERVFRGDLEALRVFDNAHCERLGLTTPVAQ